MPLEFLISKFQFRTVSRKNVAESQVWIFECLMPMNGSKYAKNVKVTFL
jgi:hypothetical protein